MMKKILLTVLLILSLVAVPVLADDATNYDVRTVEVNGIGATDDNVIYVERGSAINVITRLEGADTFDVDADSIDVNIRVWLGGYEYDDVVSTSAMFDIEEGVSYRKNMYLTLPEDLDAEKDYTLYVEVFDDENSLTYDYTIRVSKIRHLLSVQDILVNDAEAGEFVSATVRLENMGDFKEENVLVTLSSEDLGISVSKYLDELTNDEIDNEDEEDSGEVTLTFEVPKEALAGDYDLNLVVVYNRGHSQVEDVVSFHVDALEADQEDQDDSTVTVVVDSTDDSTDDGADGSQDDDGGESEDFSTALRIGFGVLAVLIVILALILIVRR